MFLYGGIVSLHRTDFELVLHMRTSGEIESFSLNIGEVKSDICEFGSFLSRFDLPFWSGEVPKVRCLTDSLKENISNMINRASFTDSFTALGCRLLDLQDCVGYSDTIRYFRDYKVVSLSGIGNWENTLAISVGEEFCFLKHPYVEYVFTDKYFACRADNYVGWVRRQGEHMFIETGRI